MQIKWSRVDDSLGGRIGCKPKCLLPRVADIVCADSVIAFEAAVLGGGVHPHHDIRLASDWADLPDQHRWREHPLLILEARAEVGDLHPTAFRVVESGYEDWRVLQIMLLSPGNARQLNAERARLIRSALSVEQ